jgi:conjugal transfer pilus assembly protein TraW
MNMGNTRFIIAVVLHVAGLYSSSVVAKDLGVYGGTFPIKEADLLAVIEGKLGRMQEGGAISLHNKKIAAIAKRRIQTPKPVYGITATTEARIHYYDPTYIVKKNIYAGTSLIAKAGTKINPLDTVSLSEELVFIDSDDNRQVEWLKGREQQTKRETEQNKPQSPHSKIIMIKGAPLDLSKQLGKDVYFDQGGIITTKLGIKQVPAIVTQEGKKLKISEIKLLEDEGVS